MLTASSFKNIVSQSRVKVSVDLEQELEGLTRSQKETLKGIVGETLISEIEKSTLKRTSPVNQSGSNAFKKLSKDYRKKKMALGRGGQPNLHLTDQMMSDLFSKNRSGGVDLKITAKVSKAKAENHNHGVTLPKRQFLPTSDGQGFKRDIMVVVNKKIKEFKDSIK